MKLHKAKQERPTKRQLELLFAVSFGEVYFDWTGRGAYRYMRTFERTGWGEFSRPIDITATISRLRAMKLVRFASVRLDGHPKEEWPRIITLTPRGRDMADDACIDLP